jgi:hypothetical protein
VETLMRAFHTAHEAAMADAEFRRQFRLLDWEEELLEADPGFREPSPTARLDAFFDPDDGSLRFTEYNAETPAGPAYMDALSEVFLATPAMGEFLRTHAVQPLPARHGVLHALLGAFASGPGRATCRASRCWTGTRCPRAASTASSSRTSSRTASPASWRTRARWSTARGS